MRADEELARAAEAIRLADALLITAGAGMGVDSGLPDFRGTEGFWRAYPAFQRLGLRFDQLANPSWFERDPHLAWGFYGHRLSLYRRTPPHEGFAILRHWIASKPLGGFVFTSNVDGQFQKAGFDPQKIVECHGSIHHLQCMSGSCGEIWQNNVEVHVDETTMRAADPLPTCPQCGAIARPNVLMFGDGMWIERRTVQQHARYQEWEDDCGGRRIAIVECGAGTAVPTVRIESETFARRMNATLIRINPREAEVPAGQISITAGSLDTLRAIDQM